MIGALVFTAACEKKANETAEKQSQPVAKAPDDPVIIKVNDAEVRMSEFQAAIESIPEQMRGPVGTPAGKKVLAEELVRMKVLEQEGAKLGVESDPAVSGRIAVAKANIIANATVMKLVESTNMTPEQLYEKTKSEFETAKVRQILIPFSGSPAQPKTGKALSEPEAKAKADALVARLRGGADFASVAKQESADPTSAEKGGDVGDVSRGAMPAEMAKVVFGLQPNTVSDPFRTAFGYHIFRVDSKSVRPFAEVKPYLEQQGEKLKAESIIEDLRNKAKVEFDPKFFPQVPGAPGAAPAAPVPAQ
jgi:parvulin-like peptidyl-prolyl isomerase